MDVHTEQICTDANFCTDIVPKCKDVFKCILLPELLFRHWTTGDEPDERSGDESQGTYCYCGGSEYGEMIECSGQDCCGKWFHFVCANIKRPPKAKAWYCKNCKPQK